MLMASLEARYEKKFNCYQCIKSTGGSGERGQRRRVHMGCYDLGKRVFILENMRYDKCIGNYQCQSIFYWLSLFDGFEKGVMPFPGTIQDQPNKLIEIFDIIKTVHRKKTEKVENGRQGISRNRSGNPEGHKGNRRTIK